ncbi:MAG: MBL fold metallo-hydrolase [Novosphingobium aromaticivorans]|nr:MBL fold metallo-hydrolase [Novosphingobium aromaticivorans]
MFSTIANAEQPVTTATLKVLPVALAAALSVLATPPVHATATVPAASNIRQAPGFFRLHVGRFEVTALLDGTHPFPATKLATGARPGEVEGLLADQFLSSPFEGMINAFLVNMDGRLILIDTGAGDLYGSEGGGLVRALQASGYSPDQIDDIYITHLHEDHAGGLLKDGKPVFAKAIVHVSQTDFDFWTNDANKRSVKPLLQPFFPAIQKVLKPYVDMGRVRPFEPSATFAPGFRAITRPGHTPGHSFYLLEDAGQAILFWGDTVHMAAVQFPEPDIAIEYDWNAPDAIAVRQQILAEAADKGWLIAGAHISFPGIGHVTRLPHASYQWVPVNYTLNR